MANLMLFSGGSNEALAKRVADKLHLSLGSMDVGRFSDGEVTVEVHELSLIHISEPTRLR